MKTIILHTIDNYTFWANKGSDSELFLSHLTGGERRVFGDLGDYRTLAEAHGWKIIVVEDPKTP